MNRQEFETFVRNEYTGLVRFAESMTGRREDAEDAVQEALLFTWRVLTGQERWEGPKPVTAAYVRRAVIDRARNTLRDRKSRAPGPASQGEVLNRVYGIVNTGRRIAPKKNAE